METTEQSSFAFGGAAGRTEFSGGGGNESNDAPFTFGATSLQQDDTISPPSSLSAAFGSDKESLTQRLQFEKKCLKKAEVDLHRAQQHYDQVAKMIEQTQAQLDLSEEEVIKNRVLFECKGVYDNILAFLDSRDLGNVAGVCKIWSYLAQDDGLWQQIVAKKSFAVPPVVTNHKSYYKSLKLQSLPERRLVYPHWQNNQDNEEYYLIVEFPGLCQSTPDGPKPIIKSIKLDESLMTDERQRMFDGPICSCGEQECNIQSHDNAWVRLPINADTAPFALDEMFQRIKYRISILRSSDCKVALLLDPASSGFSTPLQESYAPEDFLWFFGEQTLREIPNFEGTNNDQGPPLSFQVWGAVDACEDDETLTILENFEPSTFLRHFEDGGYGIHINYVLCGFVLGQQFDDNDKQHLAPPFQTKCVTEFLAMAGVEWH